MPSDGLPMKLTLPSDLRFLSIARAFIEAVCHAGDLDGASTSAIVLATHEGVSNIIRHAHRDQPEAQLQIQCRLSSEGIEICLLDEGEPFDLESVPHLNPSELRIGGRGVFLMRSLMDELSCRSHGSRGNTLRMVKRCTRKLRERDCG